MLLTAVFNGAVVGIQLLQARFHELLSEAGRNTFEGLLFQASCGRPPVYSLGDGFHRRYECNSHNSHADNHEKENDTESLGYVCRGSPLLGPVSGVEYQRYTYGSNCRTQARSRVHCEIYPRGLTWGIPRITI
jgi:hypothetical protein